MERYRYSSELRRSRLIPLYRSVDDLCCLTENYRQHCKLLNDIQTENRDQRIRLKFLRKEVKRLNKTDQNIPNGVCEGSSPETTTQNIQNTVHGLHDDLIKETYDKLVGAADDSGQMYEVEMLTLVYMRCQDTGETFRLASNYKDARKFDDIFVAREGKPHLSCVQLKHRRKPIMESSILGFSGDFSVMEYFLSYRDNVKSKVGEHCELILYTNADIRFDFCHSQRKKSFLSTNKNGHFATFSKDDVDIYNMPNNILIYKTFLQKILGDVAVVSLEDHNSTIRNLVNDFLPLKSKFPFSNKLADLKKSPTKLQVQLLIDEVENLGDLSLYYEFLEKFQVYYGQANGSMLLEVIREEIENQTGVKNINDIASVLIEKIRVWWRSKKGYYLRQDDPIWIETIRDVFWILNESKVSQVTHLNNRVNCDIVKELKVNITKNKALHVLVDGECTLLALSNVHQALEEEMCCQNIFMNLADAMNKRDSVLGAFDSRWGHVLVLEAIGIIPSTVDEFFLVVSKILENKPDKRLIVITDVNDLLSTHLVRNINELRCIECKDNTNLSDLSEETQNRLMNKTVMFQGYEVTLRKLIGNSTKIIRSVNGEVLTKLLMGEEVSIGGELPKPIDYYVPRTLTRSGQCVHAERPEDIMDRAVVIVGKPGMGKSTLITKLCKVIKKSDTSMWVVLINLCDHTSFFESITEPVDDKTIIHFLNQVVKIDPRNNMFFKECVFKHCWQTTGKMSLLLDGFDEICESYQTLVSSIIQKLMLTGILKIWITSRIMYKSVLERITGSEAFRLDSFKDNDQIVFLHAYWEKKCKGIRVDDLNNFIESVLSLVARSLNDFENSFTGIPLQTMFIAKMFEANLREYQITQVNTLPHHIDLLEMYEAFFRKKSDIEMKDKKGLDPTKKGVKDMCASRDKKVEDMYKLCSLVTLLSRSQFDGLDYEILAAEVTELRNDPEATNDTSIVHFNAQGKPVFVHRTYAEYFMGKWLSDNYKKKRHLIVQLLSENTFFMVFDFLNRILARDHVLHKAVLNNDIRTFNTLLETEDLEKRDSGGRTALHIAAICYRDKHFTKTLLERRVEVDISDVILNWTPLRYAVATRNWDYLETFLDPGKAYAHDIIYTEQNMRNEEFMKTVMKVCCERGFEEYENFLLKEGVSANLLLDDLNCTPLHIAAKQGEMSQDDLESGGKAERILDLLLKSGADINATTIHGETPLHMMAKVGNLLIVKYLIERTLDEKEEEIQSGTKRLLNLLNGNTDQIMFQKVMTQYRNEDGKTALDLAADRGFEDIVNYLTHTQFSIDGFLRTYERSVDNTKLFSTIRFLVEERNADVCTADLQKKTPLHLAAKIGELSVVEYLIENGAVTDVYDIDGNSPLHVAIFNLKLDIVNYLVQEVKMDPNAGGKNLHSPLKYALVNNHIELARTLVAVGGRTDLPTSQGDTLLNDLCRKGNINGVRFLIEECGISPNEGGTKNRTGLHTACSKGHLEIVQYIVSRGARPNARDNCDKSPLHIAATNGRLEIVKYLIEECRVDKDDVDRMSRTAMFRSCARGFIEVVAYLVSRGADTLIRCTDNNTPFHRAVVGGKLNIVTYCIDTLRFDPNCLGKENMTLLHIACMYGHLDIVRYLIESSTVNVDALTSNNVTALRLAEDKQHVHVVDYLRFIIQ